MQTLCECDISLILPVYNLEKYISPMLECLKAQDFGDYKVEIIFIINNCTDRTEEVIRESGLECEILHCSIQGCGPARNVGLEHARGNYIWMLDGDDWLLSNTAVKDVLDRAYRDDLNILYIPFESEKYKYQYFSMCVQYLLKRDYIKEFRFPNFQPSEDDAYMLMVLKKAGKNTHNYKTLPSFPKALYYYNYMREGSNMYRHYHGEKI